MKLQEFLSEYKQNIDSVTTSFIDEVKAMSEDDETHTDDKSRLEWLELFSSYYLYAVSKKCGGNCSNCACSSNGGE